MKDDFDRRPIDRDDWKGRLEWYQAGNYAHFPPMISIVLLVLLLLVAATVVRWIF